MLFSCDLTREDVVTDLEHTVTSTQKGHELVDDATLDHLLNGRVLFF